MLEVVKEIVPVLRSLGFKGSSPTFRKTQGDVVCVINFQGSRSGASFFVNLGAQPTFVPAECGANLAKLKEYDCIMRKRVGAEWPKLMAESELRGLLALVVEKQSLFFDHAQTLRSALVTSLSPEALVERYCVGTTRARAALHLARAAVALGHHDRARELAALSFELAGDGASGLRIQLNELLASLPA